MKKTKINFKTIIYALIFVLIIYLILITILIYTFNLNNKVTQLTAKIIPFPAITVNGKLIKISQVNQRLTSVKRFYENQDFSKEGLRVDFSTKDGKKRLKIKEKNVINKLIEEAIIERYAKKNKIKVTSKIISQELSRKIQEYGSDDYLKDTLDKLYGWDLEKFKENIVKPDLYRARAYLKFRNSDPSFAEAKNKIENALKELNNQGAFKDVVKKYSEGESIKRDGELGWFTYNQMLPKIAIVISSMEKGEKSEIIESSLGYHIVEIKNKKIENNIEKVELRQIITRTKTLSDWLEEEEKNVRIYIPLKDFYWNKKDNQVEFKRNELKKFENNLEKNSPDDISIVF